MFINVSQFNANIDNTVNLILFFVVKIDIMNVHLVDVVSGGIVSTITHRRVKGPVNIVHSENWLVYTYYNDKVRRIELSKFVCKCQGIFSTFLN